jgi:hypothetical protein
MEINMGNLKTLSERIVDSAGTGKADPEELIVLDGLTSSVAELNILTGVTATTSEINKLVDVGTLVASGTQALKIEDPDGGATVDTEARAAITAIIDALEAFGISADEAIPEE